MKTRAMVSPSSARIVQVQSALLWYSEGKWGLEMTPLWPRRVPPQASSAAGERQEAHVSWSCSQALVLTVRLTCEKWRGS